VDGALHGRSSLGDCCGRVRAQCTASGRRGLSGAAAQCPAAPDNVEDFALVAVLRQQPTLVLVSESVSRPASVTDNTAPVSRTVSVADPERGGGKGPCPSKLMTKFSESLITGRRTIGRLVLGWV